MSCTKILRKIHAKEIEEDSLGKAKQFRLFSIERPFMRSFHSAWFCFFVAFTSWFGLQPLLPTIRKELKLSKVDLANSGIASVAATIVIRVVIGPLCDLFGPRRVMAMLLIAGAIPMALSGLIKDSTGLIVLRLFIGILGGTFVPCQFWTSAMFSTKIVGTANAIVGGWGNLGGGFTFILMPGLFQLVKVCGADEFMAWKIAVAIPSAICVGIGISIIFTTDDCPQGKWEDRKLPVVTLDVKDNVQTNVDGISNEGFEKEDTSNVNRGHNSSFENDIPKAHNAGMYADKYAQTDEKEPVCSTDKCWSYFTVVILIIQYGMCFGVEIAVNTVLNLYFLYKFKKDGCEETAQNTTYYNATKVIFTTTVSNTGEDECSILNQDTASLIASLFGLMNLFARALGGIYSDVLRKHYSIAGRLFAHFTCLLAEGVMLIIFSQITTIPTAMIVMVAFSITVQMSEGTTYSIVPYVAPRRVGIVAGLVGAGGNAGALVWNFIWAGLVETNPSRWFWILGITVLSGSFLTLLASVQQERLWHVFKKCGNKTSKKYKEDTKGKMTKF